MDGIAPTPGLASVFAQFKVWLTDIYEHLTGLRDVDVVFSPAMRAVFDTIVTRNERLKTAAQPSAPGRPSRGASRTDPAGEGRVAGRRSHPVVRRTDRDTSR